MAQVTLMTGPERRRRWRDDERDRILEAAFAPGAVVADVARQFDVATSLIYKWRRDAVGITETMFVPAMLTAETNGAVELAPPPISEATPSRTIVVEMACGARVTIGADMPAALVKATLQALR